MNTCAKCGSVTTEGEKFCSSCGRFLEAPVPSALKKSTNSHPDTINPKSNNRIVIIVLISVIVLGLAGLVYMLVAFSEKKAAPGNAQEPATGPGDETVVPQYPEGALVVPLHYSTIQNAIDASSSGQTIIVEEGTYYENIDFMGKNIALQSTDPVNREVVSRTIIDGGSNGPAVTFRSGEGKSAIIDGFFITGGSGAVHEYKLTYEGEPLEFKRIYGGGILVMDGSSPTIRNNVIEENRLTAISEEITGVGAGIAVINGSSPLIEDNYIYRNVSEGHGGGIAVWYRSSPQIKGNLISSNEAEQIAGGILISIECTPEIEDNQIYYNTAATAGGIYIAYRSTATVSYNYIMENSAIRGGGVMVWSAPATYIDSNYFLENYAEKEGGGLYLGDSARPTVTGNYFFYNVALGKGGAVWVARDSAILLNAPDDNHYMDNEPDNIFRR